MAKKEKKTNKDSKHFFKDFKAEIKKVIWPTSKQLINTTVAIITMVIVVSVIVFGLDLAFDAMNKYGLTKLQETVQNSKNTESNDSNTTDSSGNDAETSNDEVTVEGEETSESTEE
ncbi:MAG: preprotein translocase subunit SecE [Clostridia bacterium]|nr:preprotein translocase subunit SecE [Clostridia bacterium]